MGLSIFYCSPDGRLTLQRQKNRMPLTAVLLLQLQPQLSGRGSFSGEEKKTAGERSGLDGAVLQFLGGQVAGDLPLGIGGGAGFDPP